MQTQKLDDTLIDACSMYVEHKNAFFLAKEGYVVYFDSPTGHKSDYVWQKHSIAETLRIIKTTRLTSDAVLKEDHLITALQELGRVYEFGIKSRYGVKSGVFNYYEHATTTVGDQVMSEITSLLTVYDYRGVFIKQATEIFMEATGKLGCKVLATECRRLMVKHMEQAGFVVKVGPNRVLIDGKKQGCIIAEGHKPKEVRAISSDDHKEMVAYVVNKIK